MTEEENKPARDEKGRLLPGNTANPSGENGLKGLPDHAKTCEYYLTHYTFGELKELIEDKKRMEKLSVFHAQIVTQLAASIANGKERGKERERLYDRLYGKPVQETRLTGKDGENLAAGQSFATELYGMLGAVAARKQGDADPSDGVDQDGAAQPTDPTG